MPSTIRIPAKPVLAKWEMKWEMKWEIGSPSA